MSVRLHRTAVGVLAAAVVMSMAAPAVSDEHDRPDDVPPDEPVSEPDGSGGEDEGGVSTDSHGTTGDFDDFVSIRNVSGTGLSRLNLNTTDSIVINEDTWRLANDADTGNFAISEGGTTNRLVVSQGGNVGLGIENPLSPLHIDRTGGFQLRMQGSGADYRMDAFGTSLRIGDSSNTNQFRIFGADAPFNALTVGNGIGIGTSSPASDLDIRNITGNTTTRFAITGTGGDTWSNGVTPGGFFQFNRAGTGGAEFLVRERNNAAATIDVEGPVRATAFNTTSNSAFKTNIKPVDPSTVLARLNELMISSWQFKDCQRGEGRLQGAEGANAVPCTGQGEGPLHIGPMAEDFQKVFGLGDGESISLTDSNGIMMAAIQALSQELEERNAALGAMEDKVADLESRLEALEDQFSGSTQSGRPAHPRN